jgi:hypothetical protein
MTPPAIPPAARAGRLLAGAIVCAFAVLAAFGVQGSCAPPTPAQVEKAEADLCKLRALERAMNAASDGALEPPSGSVRQDVAQAVDELCAARSSDAKKVNP